jgi:hypothetical protein
MRDKKNINLTCPKCGFEAGTTSGRTLHMKSCCPDRVHLQTRATRTIEFVVGEDFSHLSPVELFKESWGPWGNDGGYAKLKSATIHDVEVTKRELSAIEKKKKTQALKNKDRREAAGEIRAVLNKALGTGTIN